MKIRFDRQMTRATVDTALQVLNTHFAGQGIKVVRGNAKFDHDSCSVSFEFHSMDKGTGVDLTAKAEFDRWCTSYQLSPADFGRQFTFKRTLYQVCGLNTNRPKYPIIAEQVGQGKKTLFTAELVRTMLLCCKSDGTPKGATR